MRANVFIGFPLGGLLSLAIAATATANSATDCRVMPNSAYPQAARIRCAKATR